MKTNKIKTLKQYKSVNTYISALYKSNKREIDTTINDFMGREYGSKYKAFKALMLDKYERGGAKALSKTNVRKSWESISNSPAYSNKVNNRNYYKYNLTNTLKSLNIKDRDKQGRFSKLNPENVNYMGTGNIGGSNFTLYTYTKENGTKVYIIIYQSDIKGGGANSFVASKDEFEMHLAYTNQY